MFEVGPARSVTGRALGSHMCSGSSSHVAEGRVLNLYSAPSCCAAFGKARALSGPCFFLCEVMGLDHQESPVCAVLTQPHTSGRRASQWTPAFTLPSGSFSTLCSKHCQPDRLHRRGRSLMPPEEIIPKAPSEVRVLECPHFCDGPPDHGSSYPLCFCSHGLAGLGGGL